VTDRGFTDPPRFVTGAGEASAGAAHAMMPAVTATQAPSRITYVAPTARENGRAGVPWNAAPARCLDMEAPFVQFKRPAVSRYHETTAAAQPRRITPASVGVRPHAAKK
jgi:hypothetical protein